MKRSICLCKECQSMCINPCMPTPKQIKNYIKIMLESDREKFVQTSREDSEFGSIEIILPKRVAFGSFCIFWDKQTGLCHIHQSYGYENKPLEAQGVHHDTKKNTDKMYEKVLRKWAKLSLEEVDKLYQNLTQGG